MRGEGTGGRRRQGASQGRGRFGSSGEDPVADRGVGVATDYAAAVAYLDEHIGRGVKPGLDRIAGLLDMLADPQRGYPIIHVAGTNGKTSTVRMVARLLSAHGLTPGTFVSPHLHSIEERYEFGLSTMTRDEFAAAMTELAPIADLFEDRSGDLLTYFELTAALGYSWFAERAVDIAVVETGLGGRMDATNAAVSSVAVVTSIGLEHTDYLGDTFEEIAAEKLAILDEGAALVTGTLPGGAQEVAAQVAAERAQAWFARGRDFEVDDARTIERGWTFGLRSVHGDYSDIELRVHGRHQVDNFAIAVAASESLLARPLDEAGVRETAAAMSIPGRMEVVGRDPIVLLDGAHNPEAASTLAAALRMEFPGIRWILVLGVMVDKDLVEMLEPFDGLATGAHVAAAHSPRARPAADVADVVGETLGVPATVHSSVAAAVAAARDSGESVLVMGSLYVVGEARAALVPPSQ